MFARQWRTWANSYVCGASEMPWRKLAALHVYWLIIDVIYQSIFKIWYDLNWYDMLFILYDIIVCCILWYIIDIHDLLLHAHTGMKKWSTSLQKKTIRATDCYHLLRSAGAQRDMSENEGFKPQIHMRDSLLVLLFDTRCLIFSGLYLQAGCTAIQVVCLTDDQARLPNVCMLQGIQFQALEWDSDVVFVSASHLLTWWKKHETLHCAAPKHHQKGRLNNELSWMISHILRKPKPKHYEVFVDTQP